MSDEYPYEVRDPQRSQEWTAIRDTWNAWASVRVERVGEEWLFVYSVEKT